MSDVTPYLRTPRGRLLTGLGAAALVALILMAVALSREARLYASGFAAEPVFPHLAMRLADAARVTITSKTGIVEIIRSAGDTKEGRWIVPSAHNYPADAAKLQKLFLGVTGLQAIEKKTQRTDWFPALALDDPKSGGSATLLSISDSKGKPLASLFVGKLRSAKLSGPPTVYVRRADENQVYLAAGELPLQSERKDWLAGTIIDLARERVRRVSVAPLGSLPYALARAKAEEPDFTIEGLPKGKEMISTTAANPTGSAAAELNLDDVRPVGDVDFGKASHVMFETFDGLKLSMDLTDLEGATWLRLAAEGTTPPTIQEAAQIAARTKAWAFAIPGWKASVMQKPFTSLLKSPEKPGKKTKDGRSAIAP